MLEVVARVNSKYKVLKLTGLLYVGMRIFEEIKTIVDGTIIHFEEPSGIKGIKKSRRDI